MFAQVKKAIFRKKAIKLEYDLINLKLLTSAFFLFSAFLYKFIYFVTFFLLFSFFLLYVKLSNSLFVFLSFFLSFLLTCSCVSSVFSLGELFMLFVFPFFIYCIFCWSQIYGPSTNCCANQVFRNLN